MVKVISGSSAVLIVAVAIVVTGLIVYLQCKNQHHKAKRTCIFLDIYRNES